MFSSISRLHARLFEKEANLLASSKEINNVIKQNRRNRIITQTALVVLGASGVITASLCVAIPAVLISGLSASFISAIACSSLGISHITFLKKWSDAKTFELFTVKFDPNKESKTTIEKDCRNSIPLLRIDDTVIKKGKDSDETYTNTLDALNKVLEADQVELVNKIAHQNMNGFMDESDLVTINLYNIVSPKNDVFVDFCKTFPFFKDIKGFKIPNPHLKGAKLDDSYSFHIKTTEDKKLLSITQEFYRAYQISPNIIIKVRQELVFDFTEDQATFQIIPLSLEHLREIPKLGC